NPGNRSEYITKEAERLAVNNPQYDPRDFDSTKARLKSMSPAPRTGDKKAYRQSSAGAPEDRPVPAPVQPPASQYTTWTEGDIFKVSVPSNWREVPGKTSVTFAPDGAVDTVQGEQAFTHGVEIGVTPKGARDLETATDELLQSLRRSNPRLGRPGGYERD